MNISLNWLKEYVNLDGIDIKEIVDKFTISGSKVEKAEKFGERVEKVYTALVENVEVHPSQDKFKVLKLNLGGNCYTAIAKIPDVEVGDVIPVALPGAKIIGKEVISSEVEGVKSECMVCHVEDLRLEKDFAWCKPSGLISFPKDVKIGADVNEVLGLGDYIIEFEITPNRPDCLSIEGLAREAAATFNRKCKELWQDKNTDFEKINNVCGVSVKIESDNCKRYVMNVAENVEIKQSSYDMQLKLIKCGIRPINNIVDITNFVMLEVGEPLHAFDKECVKSNEIIVRQAKNGETIETLDGINRVLDDNNMVIANTNVPIAIAGVMGGELSGIHDNTKSVIIESASFVRGSVRNTSKKLFIRTDASSRYEKGLPQELTIRAMNRVCDLINATNSGKCGKSVVDIYPQIQDDVSITLDYDKLNSILGTNISNEQIDNILIELGINVENHVSKIPYFRLDLEILEDLSEEVARIYGYDKLPSTLPETDLTIGLKNEKQRMEDKITQISVGSGYNEIYTYTFFNKETLKKINVDEKSEAFNCVQVKNPLSIDFEYMRTTTIPHMLEALERNYTRKNMEVKLFELGKIFLDADNIKKNELVTENVVVTYGLYDDKSTFYDIKEVVYNILGYYNILNLDYTIDRIQDKSEYHPGISARIVVNNEVIAEFGKLSPIIKENYILPENTYIASIYFEILLKYANKEMKFNELPKYPAVERDISFVISKDVLSFDIEKAFKTVANVESVKLFDVYEGKQIEDGKKSMAYSIILRDKNKTLGEEDINISMNKIIDILREKFNTEIRK